VSVRAWQWAYRGQIAAAYIDALRPDARARGWRRLLLGEGEGEGEGEDGFVAWVAEADGVIVGFAGCGVARDDDLPTGTTELLMIYLLEAHVGEGVGRSLLAAFESYCRAKNLMLASVWVLESNLIGRDFYRRTDWVPDGVTRDHEIGGALHRELRLTKRFG